LTDEALNVKSYTVSNFRSLLEKYMPLEIVHVTGAMLVMREIPASLHLKVSRLPRTNAVTPDLAERFTKYLPNETDDDSGLKEILDKSPKEIFQNIVAVEVTRSPFNPAHKQEKQ
jgi:hypothetical protein